MVCGGEYEGTNITISSPNYPIGHPADASCVYTVTVSTGRACVEFAEFNTSLFTGIVSVFDGTSVTNIPIYRYTCFFCYVLQNTKTHVDLIQT